LFATNFAINNKDHEVAPYICFIKIYDINVNTWILFKINESKVARYTEEINWYVTSIKSQK
jgi:hypothetical protein